MSSIPMSKGYYLLLLGTCMSLLCLGQSPTTFKTHGEYLFQRKALLVQDSLKRFDSDIQLSEQEIQVALHLERLQQKMRAYYDSAHFFPPAHPFLASKAHIERTPLFQLLKKMPKGGLLHLHPAAAVDFNWMLDTALQLPGCYVYWQANPGPFIQGQIQFFREAEVPDGFFPIQHLNREIADFRNQMLDLLTLTESEIREPFDTWNEFEAIFQRFYGFVSYQPVFKAAYRNIIEGLLADGVQHIEFRTSLVRPLYDLEHEPGYYTGDSLVGYLLDLQQEVRKKLPAYTQKVIFTDLRFRSTDAIYQKLLEAYQYRKRYPDLVKGFDLVANEDDGHTTLYFLDVWMKMDSLNEAFGIDMPLYLHDGESDWADVQNLYDAVLLNSRRIGHGFNLSQFPSLQKAVRAQDICIEISPLSNQILGYIQDLRVHPGSYLLRKGIQCTINTDDPSIFGYSGMSYDFWTVFLAWELDLKALKKLAMNSLQYSSLSPKEKEYALDHWHQEWDQFIQFANEFLPHE